MGLADLFFGSQFKRTIQRYCDDQRWTVADINDQMAKLKFRMSSGRIQIVYIIKYDNTLEFSCPSGIGFDSSDEMPHRGSTYLLLRSRELKIGFWCIEKIGTKFVYSFMHNAELSLIDSAYFGRVVKALTEECDRFEGSLQS
jgi:hypothetical protein